MPVRSVERKIHVIRGQRVMLDRDLAELYMVPTIALRQQVKRNHARFPEDFVFHLSEDEANALVSQLVIPSCRSLGGFLPYAFTQQGVAMLSSVLRSDRAVRVNIAIMRAF
ncbi:MAG: ORF6N domain-containing protein, partial [Candidatus Solibacter usitatus]|nr:ORF6N domain-containing protein [Candidatus Solibacter usitatus]